MLYFSIYIIGIYILFGLLTYRDFKRREESHPFFNAVISYFWPLVAVLTPFWLLFYVIYKCIMLIIKKKNYEEKYGKEKYNTNNR